MQCNPVLNSHIIKERVVNCGSTQAGTTNITSALCLGSVTYIVSFYIFRRHRIAFLVCRIFNISLTNAREIFHDFMK